MEVQVKLDLSEIGRLAKTLEKADATYLRWRIRQAVNDVGQDVLKQARANASWSRRIPAATTLSTSFGTRSAGVTMKTNRTKVPYAFYYEYGSKNSGHRYVRHPVYGSPNGRHGDVVARYENKSTWRNTPTRPYFWKAVQGKTDEFRQKLARAVSDALAEMGFK